MRRLAATRERELRAEAEAILESITDGFLALDREWRITYVNAEAERINGLRASEMLGRELLGALPDLPSGPGSSGNSDARSSEQVSVQFESYLRALG